VVTYRIEVPLFAALPEQLRQSNLAMLGNLHQRTGDDEIGRGPRPADVAGRRQAWGRIISIDRKISQKGTVSPTSEGRLTGFQTGTDLWADANWRNGIYVGQIGLRRDVAVERRYQPLRRVRQVMGHHQRRAHAQRYQWQPGAEGALVGDIVLFSHGWRAGEAASLGGDLKGP